MSNFDFEPELLKYEPNSSLRWIDVFNPSHTLFFRILITFSIILATCISFILCVHVPQDYTWMQGALNEEVIDEHTLGEMWDIHPNSFPFPEIRPVERGSYKSVKFNIPEAEFTFKIKIPKKWKKLKIRSDLMRFGTVDRLEGEVFFSNTYFDREPSIEKNIATSLEQHIAERHYYNQSFHVLHWYIHHKTWIEYSFLYEDEHGQSWMYGVSLRWNPSWLNVIHCRYIAPVHLPQKNEEVLHFAWDLWASQFIHYCRNYEVLSWE